MRDKIILASLAVIFPFVVWNILTQAWRFRENVREAMASQQETAGDVADVYCDYVKDMATAERIAGKMLWGDSPARPERLQVFMSDIVSSCPKITHMAVTDANCRVIASDLSQMQGMDLSGFPSVERAMQGTEVVLSDVFQFDLLRRPVFAVSLGVRDEKGRAVGVVMAMSDEATVEEAMSGHIMGSGQVVILDSEGVIAVKRGGRELSWKERRWTRFPFVRRALAGEHVIVEEFRMPSGRMMLGAVEPIREFGWAVGVFCPREEVIGPVRQQTIRRSLLILALIGLTVGLAVYAGNRLANPVLDLAGAARELGQGNLDVRAHIRTGDELQSLGERFNEMAESLQGRTAELHDAVESERREAERASALYTVAQGLVATVDLQSRLEVIAHALASVCGARRAAILLRRGDRLVPGAGWGLIDQQLFRAISIEVGESTPLVHQALSSGRPIVVPDASKDPRVAPEMAASRLLKGFLALPLVRKEHVVGLAVIDNPGEYPRFEEQAVKTAREVASLAAIAVEHAMASEKQRSIADALQRSMLPSMPETLGRFRLACRYYAAIETAELGGDFYDLIRFSDDRIGLVIADVSGKGLEAAIYTAMGKYTLRAFISEDDDPARALTRVNRSLLKSGGDWGFMTMFHAMLDVETGELVYASAGHPPAVLARASGQTTLLPCADRQPPLGVFADIEYVDRCVTLGPGDTLFCYTDGAIEARRNGERFEIERLAGMVGATRHLAPGAVADAVYETVMDFGRGRLQDDIVLLVLKREDG